ncbi:hypothetical protein DSO57_1022879 [Entomophthora muscae]|uniref:Uncharacterized protein n=1 Tax=Entomophthora muscae TaxID=34485 RepID=A0ACC2SFR4_9FUNG|nr:hypothetical protein DSO57_1022879 [Entomophthora muscae]
MRLASDQTVLLLFCEENSDIYHSLGLKTNPWLSKNPILPVMIDISILVLKTWELKSGSQGKPYVNQNRQETAQLPVGSNPGPPEIDDPKQEEQKPANLPSVNNGGLKSTLETQESNPDPPKTTQVTQSGQEPTNLLNCKPELTSYSKTCQSPKDNSPNGHQITTNLAPPKIWTYVEVVACLKEVKTKPATNSSYNCQQLPVFPP